MKEFTLCLLAVMIVAGFFLGHFYIVDIPSDTNDPTKAGNLTSVLNYENSITMLAVGYFFGSSKSSADKDKTISTMADQPTKGT